MTHKMLKITPDHIKRLLAEPDVTSAVPMLEGIPAFDEAVVRHMYGDAAAMTDAEFEQFSCRRAASGGATSRQPSSTCCPLSSV